MPARLVWCESDAAKEKLAAHASASNKHKILKAPVTVIIGMDMEFYENLPELFPHVDARSWFVGNQRLIEESAMRNSTLQGAYFIMAARALGLDTGADVGIRQCCGRRSLLRRHTDPVETLFLPWDTATRRPFATGCHGRNSTVSIQSPEPDGMRTLAIETATAACSVALIEDGAVVDFAHAIVERGHAERLLPMIAGLRDGGRADRIIVDVGPGSFTGIRVGVAAARALGFGWGVPVTGYHSLALIAACDVGHGPRLAAIEGGHGEIFVARYDGDPLIEVEVPRSLAIASALTLEATRIVGNASGRFLTVGADRTGCDIGPDAQGTLRLPPALTSLMPTPFYGRGADAKPMTR